MSFVRSPRNWAVLLAAAGVACGVDAMGTGPGGEGASSGTAGADGGSSGGSSSTSSSGDPGACTPTGPEICDDGIDNDCDGKRDCEDIAACGDYACARSEADWAFVSVAPNAPPDAGGGLAACPAGWGSPRVVVAGTRSAAAACSCTCGAPSGNPCTNGTADGSFRTGELLCNDGTFSFITDGSCQALTSAWNDEYSGVSLSPRPLTNVACAATAQLPAIVDDGELVMCDLAGAAGTCADGACVKKPDAAAICLLRAGDHPTCPAGYASRRLVTPPGAFTDARTCGTCACATNATQCSDRRLSFYTNAACNEGMRSAAASNGCPSIDGSGTPTHYRYEATANGTCAPASATTTLSGAVTLTGSSTLCCP